MAAETHSISPDKLFAGDAPKPVSREGTLVSGQNIATNYTFVESDAAGKLKVHSGINATTKIRNVDIAGLLISATDASGGDTVVQYYESGCFFADQLTFPAACNTDLLKRKFVESTPFSIVFQAAGEV